MYPKKLVEIIIKANKGIVQGQENYVKTPNQCNTNQAFQTDTLHTERDFKK